MFLTNENSLGLQLVMIRRINISIILVLVFIGVFVSPLPQAFATLSITITSINNTTPRWGVDTVTVSGSLTNFQSTDTVTVVWGDGTTSPNNPITGVNGNWGPVSHIYPTGTAGSHTIVAKLYSNTGVLQVTSSGIAVTVQKHITTLSMPTFNSTSVRWGKVYAVTSDTLTDSSVGQGISGKTITISGNATTGPTSGTTNGTGNLAPPLTLRAPGIYNVGLGRIFANFAGDANYLASSSSTTMPITKHVTFLSAPTFNVPSVLWGKTFTADSILTDTDLNARISGESVSYNGNGTASTKTDFSNSTGHIQTTLTAANLAGLGQISATFAGDNNYLPIGPTTSTITITPHTTTLSTPTLNSTSVKWGKAFNVTAITLTDSILGQGISGKTIIFSGNATSGTPSGITTTGGGLTTRVTITSSANVGATDIVAGNFTGDANYLASSSSITIQLTKHVTSLSAPTFNGTSVQFGKTFTADSILTDTDLNARISGESVSYNGNGTSSITTAVSNSTGHSQVTLTPPIVASTKIGQVNATFAGDSKYLPTGPTTSTIMIKPQFVNAALIKHIVVIMQENRSFDEYFGTFPGANGIPSGECMAINASNPGLGCVRPYHTPNFTNIDLQHDQSAALIDVNGGKMDNFIAGEEEQNSTMAYQDNSTIPNYWTFAKNYVLADEFFSSVEGWSVPNHWYSLAAQAPAISIPTFLNPSTTSNATKTTYLNQANAIPSIADSINGTGTVSWKFYNTNFGNIKPGGYHAAVVGGYVYDFWNVLAAKASTYTVSYSPHFVPHTTIFADLQNNSLPQVSWVIPPDFLSEHDPASSHVGMIWTTDVIDAIMNSTAWNSTAIILTWDDYGGYYDHAQPLTLDQYGSGIRVPAIIISPYAKTGYIDHTPYIFESALKFMEWKFNMTSLTARDANANNLFNAFDFTQKPRPPTPIHLSADDLAQLVPLYIVPNTGHVGDNVTVMGNGYSPLELGTVTYNGAVVGSALANGTGTIKTTFKVPPSPAGCQTVIDLQQYPILGHIPTPVFGLGLVNTCYTVTPNEILNQTSGPSGANIKINGTGFSASSNISITFDGTPQAAATSNSTGSFSLTLTIPSSTSGSHTISATDTNSQTSSATFLVVNNTPSVAINSVNNTLPKWGISPVSVSGNTTSAASGDTVTVSWGDNTNSTGVPISGNSWGPVVHTYSSSATASNPNQVTAKLIASNNSVRATSTSTSVTVQKHITTLSALTLNSTSVKWGKAFNVNTVTLTDSDSGGVGISGKTISINGSGTTGTSSGTTGNTGNLVAPITVKAAGIFNVGTGNVFANFAGDANYLASSSSTTIQILKHATSLSTPVFTRSYIPWGQTFTVDSILTDTDLNAPVSGESVTYNGNGTTTKTDFSNSTGHIVTTLTAPGLGHEGLGQVNATFAGDNNYLPTGSTTSTITITQHTTTLSSPTLDSTSVKWGKTFTVITSGSKLVDSDLAGVGISGKTITFTGTATTGTLSSTTNSSGNLSAPVTITSSTNVGSGDTVTGNFAGDANYLASSSPSAAITINAHIPALAWSTFSNVVWGGATSFPITLTDTDNGGTSVQGKTIHFDGTGVIGVSDKITNGTGKAIGIGTAPSAVATGWTVQAHFAGDSLYLSTDSIVKTYNTLIHSTVFWSLNLPISVTHGTTYIVDGKFKDSTTGLFLGSRTITFTAASPIVIPNAVTNSTGWYNVSGLVAPAAGSYNIQAFFGGDSLYTSSSSVTKVLKVT